jgi:ABC-type antimicrobial peptide transport system permease subunit
MSLRKVKAGSLRKVLVVFQFALSSALIVCVLVIYKQMRYAQTLNPGYDQEQIVTLNTPWRMRLGDDENRAKATVESMKHELQALPDVAGIALGSGSPIHIVATSSGIADWPGRAEDFKPEITLLSCDADYMNLTGLQMAEGRWFEAGNKADESNIILNETAVRELNILEPHIGQRFSYGRRQGQVIGVVKDFHYKSLHEPIGVLAIYNTENYDVILKILPEKTSEELKKIKGVWEKFFPDDVFKYSFMNEEFDNLYKADTRTSYLMSVFGILTILIAILGLLGLAAFAVERRSKEIGIRKVLGASVASIAGLLSKEFLILVSVAFIIAVPVSWLVMNKWLENFAYHIGISAWFFIIGAAITLLTAVFAVGWQALQAANENPVKAIKTE